MADGLRYRIAAGSCALLALTWPASAAEGPPKRGGTLTYLIPADSPPSFDGHREGTFAMVHATAPFYSTLIRINPVNPSSTTDFVCDLCTGMPEPGDSGKTYDFELCSGSMPTCSGRRGYGISCGGRCRSPARMNRSFRRGACRRNAFDSCGIGK